MLDTIIFLFVLFVISLATHLIIRNKLNIEKQYIYESVNKIDKYGSILIVVVSLIIYTWLAVLEARAYGNVAIVSTYFLLLEGMALSLFRTYMQWKYNKEAKRYVLFIVGDIFGAIALLGILFVFPLA